MMLRFSCLLLALALLIGCSKPGPENPPPAVDLGMAKFLDFAVAELNYLSIDITHPTIVNGSETLEGSIRVEVPANTPALQFTPNTNNFTQAAFSVAPALGTTKDFTSPVVYTVTSTTDPAKKVHYRVSFVRAAATNDPMELTGFRFEKSKNAQLSDDVTASAIISNLGTLSKIYVFLPQGTDFSALRATVTHTGGSLVYSQDPNAVPEQSTTAYPADGLSINYAYPRHFYLTIKNTGGSKTYEVIADVRQPFEMEHVSIAVPGVNFGSTEIRQVSRLLHVGNHPLSLTGISHVSGQANYTAIRANTLIPNGGVLPGQTATVTATINGTSNPPGNYAVTASFAPKIMNQEEASVHLLPAQIQLTTTIGN